ncbi:hypothetical protein EDB19DRAFT_1824458 [Suillus lakei]|nr:hypothetical protein EDB19DRAFT_1824458 [Suillus lakei]
MSEASSYHHDYHGHPDARYYADPGEHSSTSVHRNRYDSPRRLRDVSWVSHQQQQPPSPIHDPYARWYPPAPGPEDLPTPVFPGQPLPVAHSSPMMRRTPSPSMRMPSPMIGEYMTVDDPEDEEEALPEDDGEVDFDFSNAPQHRTDGQKGARRWVGGFVKGLRKFPGLRKSPRRPSPSSGFASNSTDCRVDGHAPTSVAPATITSIMHINSRMCIDHLPHHRRQCMPPERMLSPKSSQQLTSARASKLEHMRHILVHTPLLTILILPVLILMPIHTHIHIRAHIHSHVRTRIIHIHIHNLTSSTVHPIHPNTTFTVTDYVTVPPHQWSESSPPPATRIKRFLRSLDQLPWVENEQIVDAYFPGRSSRHRRHPDSPVDDGKPAASWYNKRHDSLPKGMGMGPSSASLLYGWPPQMQKGYFATGNGLSTVPIRVYARTARVCIPDYVRSTAKDILEIPRGAISV